MNDSKSYVTQDLFGIWRYIKDGRLIAWSRDGRARVRVTLEIEIGGGAWGAECPVGQVYKQALDEAKEIIARRFGIGARDGGGLSANGVSIETVTATIIDMTPIAIITEGVKR